MSNLVQNSIPRAVLRAQMSIIYANGINVNAISIFIFRVAFTKFIRKLLFLLCLPLHYLISHASNVHISDANGFYISRASKARQICSWD